MEFICILEWMNEDVRKIERLTGAARIHNFESSVAQLVASDFHLRRAIFCSVKLIFSSFCFLLKYKSVTVFRRRKRRRNRRRSRRRNHRRRNHRGRRRQSRRRRNRFRLQKKLSGTKEIRVFHIHVNSKMITAIKYHSSSLNSVIKTKFKSLILFSLFMHFKRT